MDAMYPASSSTLMRMGLVYPLAKGQGAWSEKPSTSNPAFTADRAYASSSPAAWWHRAVCV